MKSCGIIRLISKFNKVVNYTSSEDCTKEQKDKNISYLKALLSMIKVLETENSWTTDMNGETIFVGTNRTVSKKLEKRLHKIT